LDRKSLSVQGLSPEARAVLWIAGGLTLVRLVALFSTRLELYPDEAQYWLWSQRPDWGYFSKPPLIAWAIWLTTRLGGDSEPWVRLAAPIFHLGVTLAAARVGRRLYGPGVGFAAAAIYALTPAIQLSSMVIATDAPLLFFLSLALVTYVEMAAAEGRARILWATGLGASIGLAFLSKYAALYAVVGLGLHLGLSREARDRWTLPAALAAVGACGLVLAPNLAWNAAHGFTTLRHTAANANWGGGRWFNLVGLGQFLASQFGVFGPIPFAVLIGGSALAVARRKVSAADLTLMCFALPPLAIVSVQALISRANANWSGAAYVAGAILVAAWLTRWRARGWLIAAVTSQAVIAALFLACVLNPAFAEKIGMANAFKRAKGWDATVQAILDRARHDRSLTAIAVNDRFLFNAASYYGRDFLKSPGAPPLRMWVRGAAPGSQAEAVDPLTQAEGGRVLAASLDKLFLDEMTADFSAVSDREITSVWLDRDHRRRTVTFIGQGFQPRPRDPVSGLPTRP
jgi:4-amino-4-deoxy-L-arabinose transferase-like glycosyltransferase